MNQTNSRNFAIRLYSEDKELVHMIAVNANHYAYIYHDKDVYNDDSEDHIAGDKKKPHFHMVLNFTETKTINTVRELIKKYIPHAGEMVQFLRSAKGGFDYLTHSTEEAIKDNKYRYDPSEIVSDKPTFWHEKEVQEQIKQDKEDWTVILFNRMIDEFPVTSVELISFARKYGRDYIFNFKKVYDYSLYIKALIAREKSNTITESDSYDE